MKRVIVSGGFDPIHSGHIQMISDAAIIGEVIVCLNSDAWLARKKGKSFMPFQERKKVLESIKGVFHVMSMDDSDGTACDGVEKARLLFPNDQLFFANGGDRKNHTTPSLEQELCQSLGIECIWGVGGDYKQNSSSFILSEWARQVEERPWGYFTTYEIGPGYKVKTMKVEPGKRLSLQYHNHRSETWVVAKGQAQVTIEDEVQILSVGDVITVGKGQKHRLQGFGTEACVVLELQYGEMCEEKDIVRIEDDYKR